MLSLLILAPIPAEEEGFLRIDLAHRDTGCDDRDRGWTCRDQAHYSFVVDKEAARDWKALDAVLRAAAEGGGADEESSRKVWVRAEDRTPYAMVWRLIESCSKAGLHRFVWTAAALRGEKTAKRSVQGPSPSDLWIRIELLAGKGFTTRVEDGPWISEDRELLEALRAAGVDSGTTAIIDPEAPVPWSEVARRLDLCAQSGMEKVEFLGLPAFLPTPPRAPWRPREAGSEGNPRSGGRSGAQGEEGFSPGHHPRPLARHRR
jgi:hypothetical protein